MTNTPLSCPLQCNGCPQKGLDLKAQHLEKMNWLKTKLAPWQTVIREINFDENKLWNYRDKVCLKAQFENEWKIGLVKHDEISEISDCQVHTKKINEFIKKLKLVLPPYELFPLAYVNISKAQATLVLKTKTLPSLFLGENFYQELSSLEIEGLWLHLNPVCGMNVFMGKNWKLIWGQERSKNEQGLLYGPASFSQLLFNLHQDSLKKCVAFFNLSFESRIVDLYCGNGNSLFHWQKSSAFLMGIEIAKEAVECAQINIPNAQILRGLAKDRLPQIKEFIKDGPYFLYANPSRTGLEKETASWIAGHPPEKMAYLSCSAGTLRRDLEILEQNLKVIEILPYDFFPRTRHIETLVLLSKKSQ